MQSDKSTKKMIMIHGKDEVIGSIPINEYFSATEPLC
jgi:hypothetical protein